MFRLSTIRVEILTVTLCALTALVSMDEAGGAGNDGWDSPFGIDYVYPYIPQYQKPKLAEIFAQSGARWVNFAGLGWQVIEPRPPVRGRHNYVWRKPDNAVRLWQRHGFHIVITVKCGSTWGGGPVSGDILAMKNLKLGMGKKWAKRIDRLPAPEHMEDYRAFIRALVERYDGDGRDDMPRLMWPVLHYQIGNEYVHEGFWGGSLEDYGVLLREAYTAAKQADPRVKIILAGITWNDLFHGDLEGRTLEQRMQAKIRSSNEIVARGWRKAMAFTLGQLKFTQWYDIVDLRGNGPYWGAYPGYMKWALRQLGRAARTKEIWDVESRTEPDIFYNPALKFHERLYCEDGLKLLKAMRRTPRRERDATWQWYRAEQARQTVKVLASRLGAGAKKVFIGYPLDNDISWLAALGSGANPWVGLLDKQYRPQPAFYAYKQFVEKVNGFSSAEQHINDGVWHYVFSATGRRVHVAWYDDGRAPGPNVPLGQKRVALPVSAKRVRLTPTITKMGQTTQNGQVRLVKGGQLTLVLSETPVFVEEL